MDAGYNVTRQQKTENEFIFGQHPILQARAYWYFPAASKLNFQSVERLPDGYRVGCIIDYEYGDTYEQERHRFKETKVPRQSQLIKMLQQGRIDAALMFEEEANQTLRDMSLPSDAITRGMLNHTSDIYLAFSRKNPQSPNNAKMFDLGLKRLKESGEYFQLLNNVGPETSPH
ncbi:MAG: transporter substrate-binding domain-containing protein [Sphingobacteriaceae bacterium]|nr:MAG: transporter substrate-binding domain-containing protein [Sphingobacteriaceae bacterium]